MGDIPDVDVALARLRDIEVLAGVGDDVLTVHRGFIVVLIHHGSIDLIQTARQFPDGGGDLFHKFLRRHAGLGRQPRLKAVEHRVGDEIDIEVSVFLGTEDRLQILVQIGIQMIGAEGTEGVLSGNTEGVVVEGTVPVQLPADIREQVQGAGNGLLLHLLDEIFVVDPGQKFVLVQKMAVEVPAAGAGTFADALHRDLIKGLLPHQSLEALREGPFCNIGLSHTLSVRAAQADHFSSYNDIVAKNRDKTSIFRPFARRKGGNPGSGNDDKLFTVL